MKNRVVKKVERRMLVDKLCELQGVIDEYERYLGDLLIMLIKREPQCVIKHGGPGDDKMGWIWNKVKEEIEENKRLKEELDDLRTKSGVGD